MTRLILLGAPGSGKGTQAKVLAERLGLAHLSTGDLLREEVRLGTELGSRAKQYMDGGALVPDTLILDMIRPHLDSGRIGNGFVLDGFPRTLPQAEGLDRLAGELGVKIDLVINLDVDPESIVARLTARSSCSVCGAIYNDITQPPRRSGRCDLDNGALQRRRDDEESVVRNRLEVYAQQTKPLEEYYARKGLLIQVKGDGTVEAVTTRILRTLDTLKKNDRVEV